MIIINNWSTLDHAFMHMSHVTDIYMYVLCASKCTCKADDIAGGSFSAWITKRDSEWNTSTEAAKDQ